MLPDRPLAAVEDCGRLFMPEPLQQEQRDLLLRPGQPPSLELGLDRGAQTGQQPVRLVPPAVALDLAVAERLLGAGEAGLCSVPAAPEIGDTAEAEGDEGELEEDVKGEGRRRPVEIEIHGAKGRDRGEQSRQAAPKARIQVIRRSAQADPLSRKSLFGRLRGI
jgi:hypothetical protein